MKYRPELGKVRRMLCERLDKLAKEIVSGPDAMIELLRAVGNNSGGAHAAGLKIGGPVGKVDEEWTKLCSSIGITRTAVRTENEIAMDDPMPTGALLEMSEDTVQKILVLGVP